MKLHFSVALSAAVLALAGCKTTSTQDDTGPRPIVIAPEPTVEEVPAGFEWPAFWRDARCTVVPAYGDGVRDNEYQAFANEFQANFFGGDSPFQMTDPDILAKAEERRAKFSGVSPQHAMMEIAGQETTDFVVYAKLDLVNDAGATNLPLGVSHIVRATSTCEMLGTATKGSKKVKTDLKHEQSSCQARDAELREKHAGIVGKWLAKKMLFQCSRAGAATIANTIKLTFRGYDDAQKSVIRDALLGGGVKGVGSGDVTESSIESDIKAFVFAVRTTLSLGDFQADLEYMLREEGFTGAKLLGDPSNQTILVTKSR